MEFKVCFFLQDSGRGGPVPIVMALGSCDFAYIRVHRRVGKHRVLGEQEIKRYINYIVRQIMLYYEVEDSVTE